MKRKFIALFMAIILFASPILASGETSILENNVKTFSDLKEELRSYLLIDLETEEILEEYNIYDPIEIASLSKLMTYLLVMDYMSQENKSLDELIVIDKDTASVGGSSYKLKEGEVFTVRELIEGALIVSGNDAAYGLAKYVGGSEDEFVKLMNKKAVELGLAKTSFYNSTGLPVNTEVQNLMSTLDLFKLSKHIIEKYPETLEITKKKSLINWDRDFFQLNSNPLLFDIKEVDGLKTGFTNKAGACLVSTFKLDGIRGETKDLRLVAISMGAKTYEDRNTLSKVLVEYGLNNYSHRIILDKNTHVDSLYMPKSDIIKTYLYPKEDFARLIKEDTNMESIIELNEVKLPLKEGDSVGTIKIIENGRTIFKSHLIIKEEMKEAKWYVLLWRYIKDILNIE